MIERGFIHVAGPKGAGKTRFVEAVLRGIDRWCHAARYVPLSPTIAEDVTCGRIVH